METTPAKFSLGQHVRLTDDYVRGIEETTGLKMPEGHKAGTVIGTHFDEEAFNEETRAVEPSWMYGIKWDLSDTTGVYEDGLLAD
jgi:hypothetical protein